MVFKKGFLRTKFKLVLPRLDIGLAIFAWLAYSVGFYFFLFYLKELGRLMSLNATNETYIILSRGEQFFYNALLAWISGLTGLSFISNMLFTRKSIFTGKGRTRVIVEANGLQWYSLYWYFKVSVVYVGLGWSIELFEFHSFIDYWYVFVITALVLFFHQWKSILLFFGPRAFRWQLVVLCVLGIFSASMAFSSAPLAIKIDIAINSHLPQNYIKLELPSAEPTYKIQRRSLVVKLFSGFHKKKQDSVVVMTDGFYFLNWTDIPKYISRSRDALPQSEQHDLIVDLQIDKHVPVGYVKNLLNSIRDGEQSQLVFATQRNAGTYIRLQWPCEEDSGKRSFPADCQFLYNTLKGDSSLSIKLNHDSIFLNDKYQKISLQEEFRGHLKKYPRAIFHVFLDDKSRYETLVKVRTTLAKVFLEERKRLVLKEFGIAYQGEEELEYDVLQKVRSEIPMRIIQWIGDEKQFQ